LDHVTSSWRYGTRIEHHWVRAIESQPSKISWSLAENCQLIHIQNVTRSNSARINWHANSNFFSTMTWFRKAIQHTTKLEKYRCNNTRSNYMMIIVYSLHIFICLYVYVYTTVISSSTLPGNCLIGAIKGRFLGFGEDQVMFLALWENRFYFGYPGVNRAIIWQCAARIDDY
jgi:hypothetical protein